MVRTSTSSTMTRASDLTRRPTASFRCAVELANDTRGLQLALEATVGDRYHVAVARR